MLNDTPTGNQTGENVSLSGSLCIKVHITYVIPMPVMVTALYICSYMFHSVTMHASPVIVYQHSPIYPRDCHANTTPFPCWHVIVKDAITV